MDMKTLGVFPVVSTLCCDAAVQIVYNVAMIEDVYCNDRL